MVAAQQPDPVAWGESLGEEHVGRAFTRGEQSGIRDLSARLVDDGDGVRRTRRSLPDLPGDPGAPGEDRRDLAQDAVGPSRGEHAATGQDEQLPGEPHRLSTGTQIRALLRPGGRRKDCRCWRRGTCRP